MILDLEAVSSDFDGHHEHADSGSHGAAIQPATVEVQESQKGWRWERDRSFSPIPNRRCSSGFDYGLLQAWQERNLFRPLVEFQSCRSTL